MIELRTLAYFVTACRCETLARAARAHDMSTLSTALKSLEEEIGATLFRRINVGLYPTAQAHRLLRAAEPLLAIEAFARRWLAAPRKRQAHLLTVDIGLTYTIGKVAMAIQRAIDAMAVARPDVLVDAVWIGEKDSAGIAHLAEAWPGIQHSRLVLGLADEGAHRQQKAVTLLSDRWVFATRLCWHAQGRECRRARRRTPSGARSDAAAHRAGRSLSP
jgi:LysR family transcriptional regulator, nitrogen assimilation regulatory protein